jgi:hypothetical protein
MNIKRTINMNAWRRQLLSLTSLLAAIFLLSACASTPPGSEIPEETLVDRAKNRWAALFAADFEKAYSYYSPGYRSSVSAANYAIDIQSRKVIWTSAEYRDHSCEENSCTVTFNVGYRVYKPAPGMDKWDGKSLHHETWIKTGGNWWFVDKKK